MFMPASNPMPGIDAELETLIVCDAIAQSSGKYSLIGVFNRIWAAQFPCVWPALAVYLRIRLTAGKHQVQLQMIDADQQVVFSLPQAIDVNVEAADVTCEMPLNIPSLKFPAPGEYWFQCLVNQRLLDNISYQLILSHPPAPPPTAPQKD